MEYPVILLKHFIAYNMVKIWPCRIQGKIGQWFKSCLGSKKPEIKLWDSNMYHKFYFHSHSLYSTGMSNMLQDKYTTVQYKHENVSSAQLFHKYTVV